MTCKHCCDSNMIFDTKSAKKEMKHYRKKGAIGATKKLINAMSGLPKENKTLLDIGGGIGAIQWEFLENGGSKTTDIDVSAGYLKVAEEFATEKGWQNKTTFSEGDINDVVNELDKHDFVTLDKVVCCYPDYELILNNTTANCSDYLALSFPMSGFISRAINKIGSIYFWIKKLEFKTYIHSNKLMEQLIESNGFTPIHKSIKFPWRVQVYKKT